MLKNGYASPYSVVVELDTRSTLLSGSLQDYEVDPFDFTQMDFNLTFPNIL